MSHGFSVSGVSVTIMIDIRKKWMPNPSIRAWFGISTSMKWKTRLADMIVRDWKGENFWSSSASCWMMNSHFVHLLWAYKIVEESDISTRNGGKRECPRVFDDCDGWTFILNTSCVSCWLNSSHFVKEVYKSFWIGTFESLIDRRSRTSIFVRHFSIWRFFGELIGIGLEKIPASDAKLRSTIAHNDSNWESRMVLNWYQADKAA